MNLLLLYESDFLDSEKKFARLNDRRMEHLLSVCNVKKGESIKVGLFGGNMGLALITAIEQSYIDLEVSLGLLPPAPIPLTLILALPRPKSLKKTLEAATTLGIKEIYIIESWRVEKSYWSSPVVDRDSLNHHISLGLEQARDTIAPQIHIRKRFKPFLMDEVPAIIQGHRALVAHPYDAKPCPHSVDTPVVLAIGPEGGFIPYEIELFKTQGFEVITVGERIFRVEQAVPVICGRLF